MFYVLLAVAVLIWVITWVYKLTIIHYEKTPLKLEQANQKLGELQTQLKLSQAANLQTGALLLELQQNFGKLQHQKISADVRIGQKTENILPFLAEFPYKDEEIRGLFNPIDLIVFAENEVIFVEVKTGAAQLSDKQRRIRDNIKAGRVRFEIHRLNEKGVSVKS